MAQPGDLPREQVVGLVKRAIRARHEARAERPDSWDCTADEFDPQASDDGRRVYCGNCGLVVWEKPGEHA